MDDRYLSNERVTVVTVVAHIIQFSADVSVPLLYHTQETFVKVDECCTEKQKYLKTRLQSCNFADVFNKN